MKEWITEIISLFSCLIALAVPFIMDKIERKRQEDRDRQEMYVKAKILCSKLTYCVSYYTGNKQYSLFTEEANPQLYELTNAIFELLMKMKTIFRRKNHRLSLRQLETKLEEVSVSILPLSDIEQITYPILGLKEFSENLAVFIGELEKEYHFDDDYQKISKSNFLEKARLLCSLLFMLPSKKPISSVSLMKLFTSLFLEVIGICGLVLSIICFFAGLHLIPPWISALLFTAFPFLDLPIIHCAVRILSGIISLTISVLMAFVSKFFTFSAYELEKHSVEDNYLYNVCAYWIAFCALIVSVVTYMFPK